MSAAEDRADVVLVEPARQRLVVIAADVLGRMAPEEIPSTLRTIAKFTPAKRARLGGATLSAALDADDVFRERVARVVAEASPQLADAVKDGSSTAASDPIHTAIVAYLTRPEGWVQVVNDANARWAEERGGAETVADETATLRAQLADARVHLKSERARVREAVVGATGELNAELTDLRRQLRERTVQLRTAERARAEARAELSEAHRRVEIGSAAHEVDLRRLRARIGDLERAASSAKREARSDRDVDDARLWLLVETLAEAAAGIRRELSLAAPTVRPADIVGSADDDGPVRSLGPTRRIDDPAAMDRLLALPAVHLIVDGYNVTKTGYGDLSLADQRVRLIGSMATLAVRSGAEVTIAFDGGTKPPAQPRTPRGVRVLFSRADEIADDLIRQLVAQEPAGRPVVVVTSDQQVVTDVLRAGAWTVPSAVLLARLG